MKRFLALLLVSTTLLSTCAFGAETTRYVCNGAETTVASTAVFKDGYTYLPIAQVGKALGYYVVEKSENNSVTVMPRGKAGYVSVFLGKQTGRMNGQNITLGKAPFSDNGVIYVSSKLIEEQLGVKVGYDSSKNTVYITASGEGKITSTVGKAPVATASKSTASTSTANTTATSSGAKIYSGFKYTPDFAAVTGCNPTVDSTTAYLGVSTWGRDASSVYKEIGSKNVHTVLTSSKTNRPVGMQFDYTDAKSSDVTKYISALKSAGFTVADAGNGMTKFEKNGEKGVIAPMNGLADSKGYAVEVYYAS
jgi:hypothetical protein